MPSGKAEHERPDGQIVSPTFDDLSDTEAAHYRAQLNRWDVGTQLAHPDAIRGIKGEVQGADQRLALVDFCNGFLDQLKILFGDLALWSRM
ncbi:alcohol dehydrogenase, zinc-binding domain protein [Mycobacteroides abscessus 4S-0206]|nr:alcohol dehydrogenase, zinc-binding domain protein [Mycobacteroides abscessus 4S-0206]